MERWRDEQLHVGGVRGLDDVTASTSHYCTAEKGNFTHLPDCVSFEQVNVDEMLKKKERE